MKRTLFSIVCLTLFGVLFVSQPTFADAQFEIGKTVYILNGSQQEMNVYPYISNGRTFMPIRYVAYVLGIEDSNILWDNDSQTVTLLKGDKVVQVQMGSNNLQVNNDLATLDAAPEINNGRICLPIALVASVFGFNTTWDPATQTVTISAPTSNTNINTSTNVSKYVPQSPEIILGYGNLSFEWLYKNTMLKWEYGTTKEEATQTLQSYRQASHPARTQEGYVLTYCNDLKANSELTSIAKNLQSKAKLFSGSTDLDVRTISYIGAFVNGLSKNSESKTGYDDYIRYPIETFLEQGGDSEDTSILAASLLQKLGLNCALLYLDKNHCAVGIAGDDTVDGNYYLYKGTKYFYLETFGVVRDVGVIPEQYQGCKANVVPL